MDMAACIYLCEWLRGDVGGVMRVNTYLPDVPLLSVAGHVAPSPLALITAPYYPGVEASNRCARGDGPMQHPALYVSVDGATPAEGEVRTIFRDGKVRLAVRYLVQKADAARRAVEAAYSMKAIEMCVCDWLNDDAAGRAARGDDGPGKVYVINAELAPGGIVYGEWDEDVGDSKAIQVMTIALDRVRDTQHAG
jgi:hypothetical protein